MASLKVQFLRCATSLIIAKYEKYASFFGLCGALNLNFLLCHRNLTYRYIARNKNSLDWVKVIFAK